MIIKQKIKNILYSLKRFFLPSTIPTSKNFGFEFGKPIDRFYIEDFLSKKSEYIKGVVCEVGDDKYTRQFETGATKIEIFHVDEKSHGTIIGDLTCLETLPENYLDCFILTSVLNHIYDYQKAIEGIHKMLKPGGIALVTVPGLSQISLYDYERWGDYWRFTDMSIKKVFEEFFGSGNVSCQTYGNVYSASAGLYGKPSEKLSKKEILFCDPNYQVVIGLKATKVWK